MSSENFEEIVGIESANQCVTVATKEALRDAVHEKVRAPTSSNSWVGRELRRVDHGGERINVTRYGENASRRRGCVIAQIAITEFFDESKSESGLRTEYRIIMSPDGLQMSRSNSATQKLGKVAGLLGTMLGTMPGEIASGRIDMNARRAQFDAEKLENELGLNTVTETEALAVLAITREAQPVLP